MGYSDRMDVNMRISLYEYSLIRNPKTDKVIICTNCCELEANFRNDLQTKPNIKTAFISLQDVKEALEEQGKGYFDFIGSDKKTELANLNNDYLTHHIYSMEQYNGWFELHLR